MGATRLRDSKTSTRPRTRVRREPQRVLSPSRRSVAIMMAIDVGETEVVVGVADTTEEVEDT